MPQTTTFTLRVPAALRDRLDKLAEATDRSRSWLAAQAIAEYVEAQEWQIETVEQGLADIKSGRFVEDQRVDDWLDSWGTDSESPPPPCE